MFQNVAERPLFAGDGRRALADAIDAYRRLASGIVCWYKQRRAICELSALDDRTLRDIGVRYDDIHSVTGKIFRGNKTPVRSPSARSFRPTLPEAWTVAGRARIERVSRQAIKNRRARADGSAAA